MRYLIIILALSFCNYSRAQETSYEIAKTVVNVEQLSTLVSSAFGGGFFEKVEMSPFYFVDLQQTSGILSSEYYIYQEVKDGLKLVAYFPLEGFVSRRLEYFDGTLSVYEQVRYSDSWRLLIELQE